MERRRSRQFNPHCCESRIRQAEIISVLKIVTPV
jgi:hypothetical protein